jgi:ribosomal protein S21
MPSSGRLRLGMIVALLVALTTAGIGLASEDTDATTGEVSCQPTGRTTDGDTPAEQHDEGEVEDEAQEDEGEIDEAEKSQPADDRDEASGLDACDDSVDQDESEKTDEGASGAPSGARAEEPSSERIAACTGAAGLTSADAPTEKPTAGELHGPQNAIAHVLWNCVRNDNEGLPNALSHLKANLDHALLRDELKAQRVAEREAARSARRAAHAAARAADAATHAS